MFASTNIFVFSLLCLCAVNIASARRCYVCNSDKDVSCASGGLNKYDFECPEIFQETSFMINSVNVLKANQNLEKMTVAPKIIPMGCASTRLSWTGNVRTIRGCNNDENVCSTMRKEFEELGISLDTCVLCDTDLCNSSSRAQVELFGLSIILAMVLTVWK